MNFNTILEQYRRESVSERDKGRRFEQLMQCYLLTEPYYATRFSQVWMWNEFPYRKDLGGQDTGIDLVAQTTYGTYWAVQCKCYRESATISKAEVDSFLATAGRSFTDDEGATVRFDHCLWISTTNNWSSNAEEAIRNHTPSVSRISLYHLQNSSVDWDKLLQGLSGEQSRKPKHQVKEHQQKAIEAALLHYQTADRGKLIMACGTGKTFTSLRIAEQLTGGEGIVLFLIPSIALLGQTLAEWTANASQPINAVCICSDPEASKRKEKNEDSDGFSVIDLALPASTDTPTILKELKQALNHAGLTVVFSTYQSIEVIAKAQRTYNNGGKFLVFDLIICDEAHRTTGVSLSKEDESAFVKVHSNDSIAGRKRMYMTATPRLYHDTAKQKAAANDVLLCSMDDEQLYGQEFYHIGFSEAVKKGLLSDYKVLVLTVNEHDMSVAAQNMVREGQTEIPADDVNKLIGCINALSKEIVGDQGSVKSTDPDPMVTAVAFCQNIRSSKQITNTFNQMGDLYYKSLPEEQRGKMVMVESDHIDGTMAATVRGQKLSWLKSVPKNEMKCRILTNVRCLSEGVDVPSLDAVMFLSARNSQVDVVQSVGRVMRRAEGKRYGYIIIPIVVPSGVQGEKALGNNVNYAVVWTVLNALRAHDDRFKATINKLELNKNKPASIIVGGASHGRDGADGTEYVNDVSNVEKALQLSLDFDKMQTLLYAKLVEKVGERRYWEQWAKDVADIATRRITGIKRLLETNKQHRDIFSNFIEGLRKNINPFISEDDAIEMLAQHMVTRPVFEALFEEYSFVKNNAISQSMEQILNLLEDHKDRKDTETLQRFYNSVYDRAKGIDNAEGKQKIIIELYDKFFRSAFPLMVERLGIVYTPVEVVDYIIHSVDDVLRKEFGRSLSDENLHILDPFTGTGTFITRLLQSGLIRPADLKRKYESEIHANEIVLLAYYIASVNIENVYHDLMQEQTGVYRPFNGVCLTDTFQLGETRENDDLFSDMFPQNSARVQEQQKTPLMVIMGNPPYSIGQKSANDNAQNRSYPKLNERIEETYAKFSTAGLKRSLYDAYIKAFRWSTDRLSGNDGVIAFVSNGARIDGNSTDGFRRCLEQEFSAIYVFNLRGNQRTNGELSRKEGGKIFGSGSRTQISITILVKKQSHVGKAKIFYRDIGDYLSREEKLAILKKAATISDPKIQWQLLSPNAYSDWISPRAEGFSEFIPLAPEKKFDKYSQSFFVMDSCGIVTAKDMWVKNFSKESLIFNLKKTIRFYNDQRVAYKKQIEKNPDIQIKDFVQYDSKEINWSRSFLRDAKRGLEYKYDDCFLSQCSYRPFSKENNYFNKSLIAETYQMFKIFPTPNSKNMVICLQGTGGNKAFGCLITDTIPDYGYSGVSTHCFPLYWYETPPPPEPIFNSMKETEGEYYARRDAISDFILKQARGMYGAKTTKKDIFYYVYAMLHNPDYCVRYASDLKKALPRLPLISDSRDFWRYVQAGRELAELHLHYEDYEKPNGVSILYESGIDVDYKVTKMSFPPEHKTDKREILYNKQIRICNIPAEAYEYVINGKSAIEWVMERYQVTTHKESGIVNNPNDWAREQGKPKYILSLLLSIITVSVKTMEIVKGLPAVDLE